MDASRLTITLRFAMRNAPRERLTVITIGSSSGVRPTARAAANKNNSMTGRPKAIQQAHDQQAEPVNAALKGARLLIAGERRGDTAEAGGGEWRQRWRQ